MGIQILNLRMKVFLAAVLFCGAALVQAKSSPVEHEFVTLARSIRSNKQSKSTHKASSYDLAAECGIEGPPSKDRIVGGFEAEENQWPWQVALRKLRHDRRPLR